MKEFLQSLRESSIALSIDGDKIKVEFLSTKPQLKILEEIKIKKSKILEHLFFISHLRKKSWVATPFGVGTVFEIMPVIQRVGILIENKGIELNGVAWPVWYYFEDISPI